MTEFAECDQENQPPMFVRWMGVLLLPQRFKPISIVVGIFTVTTLAAMEAGLHVSAWKDWFATLISLVDLFVVSGVALAYGFEYSQKRSASWGERARAASTYGGVLSGGGIPLVVMLIAVVAKLPARSVDYLGVGAGFVLMVAFALVFSYRTSRKFSQMLLAVLTGLVICALIILERAVIR